MIKLRPLAVIFLLSITCAAHAGINQTDTFTINTYYPSPRGIYKTLEAKTAFAVGEVHDDPKIASMDSLTKGQLYVGDSIILRSHAADPATGKPGQLIYSTAEKTIRYYNGSAWVNVTTTCPTPAPVCGSANKTYAATATGYGTDTFCLIGNRVTPPAVQPFPGTWTCKSGEATIGCKSTKASSASLYTGVHTEAQCSSYGNPRDASTPDGRRVCEIGGTTCPPGWTKWGRWGAYSTPTTSPITACPAKPAGVCTGSWSDGSGNVLILHCGTATTACRCTPDDIATMCASASYYVLDGASSGACFTGENYCQTQNSVGCY